MHGPFCAACGQPKRGLVRHFTSFVGDFVDTVFDFDSRLFRTIGPLLLRPGFLTTEYLAGRRTRYVTPFRLFFVLCVLSFFALHAATPDVNLGNAGAADEAVKYDSEPVISALEKARTNLVLAQRNATAEEATELAEKLAAIDVQLATVRAGGVIASERKPLSLNFGNGQFDPVSNPIRIASLPDSTNEWINQRVVRVQSKLEASREDPEPFVDALFAALPPMLFVVLPLFALILKVWYVFKRRFYMEHLLVAIHSHAFLSLMLLLMSVSMLTERLLPTSSAFLFWVDRAIWIWTIVYLFLMQKRIYRHGWMMGIISFGVIGVAYVTLISLGLAGALVAGVLSL